MSTVSIDCSNNPYGLPCVDRTKPNFAITANPVPNVAESNEVIDTPKHGEKTGFVIVATIMVIATLVILR